MKTRTWIILTGTVLALCLGLSVFLLMPGQVSDYAEIRSQSALLKIVDLRIDQEFTVTTENGGSNTVTVRDGKIAVTQANCPDHYCMHRGFCNSGSQIVCLPNRLVITFVGEPEIDMVIG